MNLPDVICYILSRHDMSCHAMHVMPVLRFDVLRWDVM